MLGRALWVIVPICAWKLFFERVYWEYPPIDEKPEEVAAFKEMIDRFMADEFRPLTEAQIDAYFRDGWITIDAFIPRPIAAVLAKYNDHFKDYTWHYNTCARRVARARFCPALHAPCGMDLLIC